MQIMMSVYPAGFDSTQQDMYTRRKIVLSPSDYVGARITEVGFGYSTSSGSAVTHSMLKDSEGNQIAIEKTDTDVLTIYATFYLTLLVLI